jgi:signal transduction histidine kinase
MANRLDAVGVELRPGSRMGRGTGRIRPVMLTRLAWSGVAVAGVLALLYPVLLYLDRNAGFEGHGFPGISELVDLATVIAAGLVIARQPKNSIGWMLLFIGLAGQITSDIQLYSLLANTVHHKTLLGGTVSAWLGSWLFDPPLALLVTLVLLLFPNGRLPSPRWRLVGWLSAASVIVASVGAAVGAIPRSANFVVDSGGVLDTSSRIGPDFQALSIVAFACGVVCVAGLIVRFRRSRGPERQQLKWFAYGGVVFVAGVVVSVASVIGPGSKNAPAWSNAIQQLSTVAVPTAIAIAVLKYRLYDIDVVISRTLVYGALAAFITAVYVGIAVGIGSLVGSGGKPNLGLSILATAIVAVGFQPVRERLQTFANRLVYGKRATPYEVLSQFSERVAESYASDDVLPRMARVLAEGTGAELAEVWLRSGGVLRRAAAFPLEWLVPGPVQLHSAEALMIPDADRTVEVRHQGELLGALTASKRRGESLTPIEIKLMDDLAHQAGLVLKNVGLTADLQARLEDLRASRQRLVAAQDSERRRLERNLHDGAQQHLVAIKVKLGLVEMLATRDPEKAKAAIVALKHDADEALETLRDLARGIYPPLLAEQGLAAALQSQAGKATLPVHVDADGVGRYPQETEAALYFCTLEALQNVQKYAAASAVAVRLREDEKQLLVEVTDDGCGFDVAGATRGAGLTNMEDRLEALGGTLQIESTLGVGTTLRAAVPVSPAVPVVSVFDGLALATSSLGS